MEESTLKLFGAKVLEQVSLTVVLNFDNKIGKPKDARPQPILVKFKTESDRRLLLIMKSKLKHTSVRIHEDLTPVHQDGQDGAMFSTKIK